MRGRVVSNLAAVGVILGAPHDAETREHGARLIGAARKLQKARRLRQQRAHEHQQESRGKIQQPHHAPAESGLQQRGEAARGDETADGTHATDQYQAPAAMAGRHDLGQQRVGDRQHPAGGGTHQEAHRDVPPEARHRAADRGADEHHRGKKNCAAAPVQIRQRTPDEGADSRAGECRKGQPGDRRAADRVLHTHSRRDEPEAGRLHDVDDEGQREKTRHHPVT